MGSRSCSALRSCTGSSLRTTTDPAVVCPCHTPAVRVQQRSIVFQAAAWSVLVVLLLVARSGPIDGTAMSLAGVVLLLAAGAGLIATPHTGVTWTPASVMAWVVLARPVAATLDAPAARTLVMSLGPFAVVAAVWWMAGIATVPRRVTVLTTIAAFGAVGADLAFRDPYREQFCHPLCSRNPWLVDHRPDVTATAQWLVLATYVIASVVVVRSMLESKTATWRTAVIACVAVAGALVGLEGTQRSENAPGSAVASTWRNSQLLLMTAAVIAGLVPIVARLLRRRRIARWASLVECTSGPGGVVEMLRHEVGDRSLALVAATGDDALAKPGRAATSFVRNGRLVAVVEHRRDAADRLRAVASAPVVAALENETLLATAQRELAELRVARRSVVERSDEARRRLQRDLHDGAQQRLIALGLELSSLADGCDVDRRHTLERAALDAGSALTAVRRIAHRGVPPLLDEQGLCEALASLSEDAPIAIHLHVDAVVGRRFTLDVERAAYQFVAASAQLAKAAESPMMVSVECDEQAGTVVVVTTSAAGVEVSDRTADVDRVEALGGTVRGVVRNGRVVYEARLPCE